MRLRVGALNTAKTLPRDPPLERPRSAECQSASILQWHSAQAQVHQVEAAVHHGARATSSSSSRSLHTSRTRQCRAVLLACGACKPLEHHTRPPSLHVCALPDSTSHCALCLRILPRACSRIRAWTRCIGILVMVGTNQNKFKPSVKAIKELYYPKFRGKGGEPRGPDCWAKTPA